MLTILILLILVIGFYTGLRRGLILQIVYTFGYLISYMIAKAYYKQLAPYLELYIPYPAPTADAKLVFFKQEISFELDKAFYAGVAFLLILILCWLAIRFLCIFAHSLMYMSLLKQANGLAGGIMSAIVMYIGITLVLNLFCMVPLTFVQNQFESSGLARFMVQHTPVFSNQIHSLWIEQIIK